MPLNLFRRDLNTTDSVRKLKTWFFIARLALAITAVIEVWMARQVPLASVCALAAALPLEKCHIPCHWFSLPSGCLAAWAVHRTGVEHVHPAVLGLFAFSVVVFLLGTLTADLRWME